MKNTKTKKTTERIKTIFTKHKWLLWHTKTIIKPKEPIAWLIRENGNVEYHEKVSTGDFEFDHSNGEEMIITIPPETPTMNFTYGNERVRGYLLHENHPFPLPEDPLVTAQTTRMIIDKITHDVKTARTQEIEARSHGRYKTLIGIAIIIGIIVVGVMVIPWDRFFNNTATTTIVEKTINTTGKIIKENMTALGTIK